MDWFRRARTTEPPRAIESVLGQDIPNILPEDVYHDAARHFLDVQISTHDVHDTKTAQTFSVGSVVLPVTFALLNLGAREVPMYALWALGLALVFYIALLVCAARASLFRGMEYRPNISTLRVHSERYSGAALKRWVADEYEESISINSKVLVKKGRWVGAAALAMYFEALSLSVAAIVTLLL